MAKFTVKLKDKKEVAKETMTFYFAKPAGYTFIAGPSQFVLAMCEVLFSSGVDDLSIKSEEFEGY